MTSTSIFWHRFVSLVKFSYWSKFRVNIITGSGIMTIFFYEGLTRNPEIRKTTSEFCPISRDWGELLIPNLARMSLIECYWILRIVVVGAVRFSADKPLDFHDFHLFQYHLVFLKYNKVVEVFSTSKCFVLFWVIFFI